ncbi:hypothetical protein pb186bvf_002682 [Paramecium bursaria]
MIGYNYYIPESIQILNLNLYSVISLSLYFHYIKQQQHYQLYIIEILLGKQFLRNIFDQIRINLFIPQLILLKKGSCIPTYGQFDENSFNTYIRAQNQNSIENKMNQNSENKTHNLQQILHMNWVNKEQDYTFQYDLIIKPFYQFSKYCLALNKQHYIYHNLISLIIQNFREQISYQYFFRELNLNQITSIKITQCSNYIYVGIDQSFFKFALFRILLQLNNQIQFQFNQIFQTISEKFNLGLFFYLMNYLQNIKCDFCNMNVKGVKQNMLNTKKRNQSLQLQ